MGGGFGDGKPLDPVGIMIMISVVGHVNAVHCLLVVTCVEAGDTGVEDICDEILDLIDDPVVHYAG